MTQRETHLSPEGVARVQEELEYLRTVRRKEIAEQLKRAVEVGGTVDNAEYEEAKREQAQVEGRIRELETLLHSAQVLKPLRVTVQDSKGQEWVFTIVGSAEEANPAKGRISKDSPVGRALWSGKPGQRVEVRTPAGLTTFQILKVE